MQEVDAPDLHFFPCDELPIAVWEWPGEDPPLLFAHATGFHGRCWDHIVELVPGRHAFAVEFRGHGRSGKPVLPVSWARFAGDLMAAARRFGIKDALGVGHSMGGHSLVAAAIQEPGIFASLVLIDPVIFPPEYYGALPPDASFILRRRNEWSSPGEMFERFRTRRPFVTWREQALRNYCDFGLLPEGDGFVLACTPEMETATYLGCNSQECNLYAGLGGVRQRVTILRAGTTAQPGVFDLSASPTAPDLAAQFPDGHDVFLESHNHFIPMEDPEMVAAAILDA